MLAQIFGITGLIISVLSYQVKNNSKFVLTQGASGLMFFLNYILIGAMSGALFNLIHIIRGILLSKTKNNKYIIMLLEVAYILCFIYSLTFIKGNLFGIFLSSLTFLGTVLMTYLMWKGNSNHIRYGQFLVASPSWLIYNIFNLSIGGIICEIFSMMSIIIYFVRQRRIKKEK